MSVANEPSSMHGASQVPLLGETIGQNLDRTAARVPDRDALVSVHQGVPMTYAELHAAVEEVARGLLALGVEAGERVGIWSPNASRSPPSAAGPGSSSGHLPEPLAGPSDPGWGGYSVRAKRATASPSRTRQVATTIAICTGTGTCQEPQTMPGSKVARAAGVRSRWSNTTDRIGSTA
jgi:hypothetical protein